MMAAVSGTRQQLINKFLLSDVASKLTGHVEQLFSKKGLTFRDQQGKIFNVQFVATADKVDRLSVMLFYQNTFAGASFFESPDRTIVATDFFHQEGQQSDSKSKDYDSKREDIFTFEKHILNLREVLTKTSFSRSEFQQDREEFFEGFRHFYLEQFRGTPLGNLIKNEESEKVRGFFITLLAQAQQCLKCSFEDFIQKVNHSPKFLQKLQVSLNLFRHLLKDLETPSDIFRVQTSLSKVLQQVRQSVVDFYRQEQAEAKPPTAASSSAPEAQKTEPIQSCLLVERALLQKFLLPEVASQLQGHVKQLFSEQGLTFRDHENSLVNIRCAASPNYVNGLIIRMFLGNVFIGQIFAEQVDQTIAIWKQLLIPGQEARFGRQDHQPKREKQCAFEEVFLSCRPTFEKALFSKSELQCEVDEWFHDISDQRFAWVYVEEHLCKDLKEKVAERKGDIKHVTARSFFFRLFSMLQEELKCPLEELVRGVNDHQSLAKRLETSWDLCVHLAKSLEEEEMILQTQISINKMLQADVADVVRLYHKQMQRSKSPPIASSSSTPVVNAVETRILEESSSLAPDQEYFESVLPAGDDQPLKQETEPSRAASSSLAQNPDNNALTSHQVIDNQSNRGSNKCYLATIVVLVSALMAAALPNLVETFSQE